MSGYSDFSHLISGRMPIKDVTIESGSPCFPPSLLCSKLVVPHREWILRVMSTAQWLWRGKAGIGRETKAYASRVLRNDRDLFAGFYVCKRKRKRKKWNFLCKLVLRLGFLIAHVCIRSRPSLARLEPCIRAVDWALVTLSLCRRSHACDLVFVPLFWLFAIWLRQ